MTTAYTSLLGLALPVTGELSGTWGDTVNNSITSLLDSAIAGTTTLSTDADVTLTTTTGAANTSREAILLCSGARTGIKTITAPAQSKIYTIINATTGGYAVKLVGVGPTTGLTIPNGSSAVVAWNGSDFIEIGSATVGNFTVNGNLSVTGNTTLGDASADTVTVNGTVTSNLIFTDNTYDIGASGATRPRTGYFGTSVITPFVSSAAATNLLLKSAGTTAVTIDTSQNVGLGATPTGKAKFEVNTGAGAYAGISTRFNATNFPISFGVGNANGVPYLSVNARQVSGTDGQTYDIDGFASRMWCNGGGFAFFTAPSGTAGNAITFTQAMTLDASGNLGLGVTPSAWDTSYKAIQVVNAVYAGNALSSQVGHNWYYNGGTKYIANAYATNYYQYNGQHVWQTAASGTAGNAITFTQAMTLDASGNLGIGTTSPAYPLQVAKGNPTNGYLAVFGNSTANGNGAQIAFDLNNVAATAIGMPSNTNALAFYVNSNTTERMRIDSSGNLLVGTTATVSAGPTSKVISYAGSASTAAISAQYGNSYTGQLYRADSLTTSGTGWSYFMGLSGNGTSITTTQIQILGNGNIQNTNNSYGAISDIKRKENITDATPKLEKLNQVRVVNFNMIGEKQKQLGVIAQELEQVFPSMIEETPDRDVEGNDLGTTTKSVKYSVFVPMLIKAIQEQNQLIQSLTDRLTALEAK